MLRLADMPDGRKAIIIRTSDRIAFKQCRRKWGWSSHLKGNLGAKQWAAPLWFGSAIHYALEDFHGYNYFGSASNAFRAFCIATSKQAVRILPPDANSMYELGIQMMDYYQNMWLPRRERTETFWINGQPQVEVNFAIEIPLDEYPNLAELARINGADAIIYRGTIDRVAVDRFGNLWVVEYKTAKMAAHSHYMTDPQVSTYMWAAQHIYDRPVAGVVYYQFVKEEPKEPRILSSGKISTSQQQATSYPLYSKALTDFYGHPDKAPPENREFLNTLSMRETENRDRYIQREYVTRNAHQCDAEAEKIILELEDMLNPNLPLYPNPVRQCPFMCSFLGTCVTMDDGGDWETSLSMEFDQRDQAGERFWRNRLPAVDKLQAFVNMGLRPDLESLQEIVINAPEYNKALIESGEFNIDVPFTFD